jgi:hypothetical protein
MFRPETGGKRQAAVGFRPLALNPNPPSADFHRGSAPLVSLRSCHPDDLGELLPQTPSGSNPRGNKKQQAAVGFEPTDNGFANRRLCPLGYAAGLKP